MKKYLGRALVLTALISILTMLAGCVASFAGASVKEARASLTELMDMAQAVSERAAALGAENPALEAAQLAAGAGVRATLIDEDGRVLYESDAEGELEDHSGREEIVAALAGGTGYAQRQSESLGSSMIYCARRVSGGVLRLSTQSDSAYSILYEMLPLMIALALLLGAGSVLFARRFAARFTGAIQALDDMLESGRPLSVDTFEELQPVLQGVACRI